MGPGCVLELNPSIASSPDCRLLLTASTSNPHRIHTKSTSNQHPSLPRGSLSARHALGPPATARKAIRQSYASTLVPLARRTHQVPPKSSVAKGPRVARAGGSELARHCRMIEQTLGRSKCPSKCEVAMLGLCAQCSACILVSSLSVGC